MQYSITYHWQVFNDLKYKKNKYLALPYLGNASFPRLPLYSTHAKSPTTTATTTTSLLNMVFSHLSIFISILQVLFRVVFKIGGTIHDHQTVHYIPGSGIEGCLRGM